MTRIIPENSTPIINKIIEKLANTRLSTYEFNIIFAIIRKTYGWDKGKDVIKNKHLVALTGMRKQHVSRTLEKLVQRKIVTQVGYKIGINRYTEQWTELPKQVTCNPSRLPSNPSRLQELPKQVTNNRSAKYTNKRDLIKETTTMEIFELMKFKNEALLEPLRSLIDELGFKKVKTVAQKVVGLKTGGDEGMRWLNFVKWCKSEKDAKSNASIDFYSNLPVI